MVLTNSNHVINGIFSYFIMVLTMLFMVLMILIHGIMILILLTNDNKKKNEKI